jgi:hypothetical protein
MSAKSFCRLLARRAGFCDRAGVVRRAGVGHRLVLLA